MVRNEDKLEKVIFKCHSKNVAEQIWVISDLLFIKHMFRSTPISETCRWPFTILPYYSYKMPVEKIKNFWSNPATFGEKRYNKDTSY